MADDESGVSYHDYHRTIIGYHGTDETTARSLVDGHPFKASDGDNEWFGQGIYFWEYAPKQAWWWAQHVRNHSRPAVVGAVIRLGQCLDLLDPDNVRTLQAFSAEALKAWKASGETVPKNNRKYKKLDCALFNLFYDQARVPIESARAVYVPTGSKQRAWTGSWIYEEAHIQVCVREPKNILAAWHVRRDGRYGKDD